MLYQGKSDKKMLKKLLLGATVCAFLPSIALAQNPTVTVGGFSNFMAGITSQKDQYSTGSNSRDTKFLNDNEVKIRADGTNDAGLKYGAVIDLEADVTSDTLDQGLNAHKTYVYMENTLGRLELGSAFGPSRTMKIDAFTVSRGFGGVEGNWTFFTNVFDVGAGDYILVPELPLDYGTPAYGLADTENASKVVYYTPEYKGLQLGVGYVPDSGNRGTAAAFNTNTDDPRYFENIGIVSATYKTTVRDFNFATNFGGQYGNAQDQAREDLNAYAIGASINYDKFTLGGSYSDWGKTSALKTAADKDADYWSLAGSYVNGPVGASLGYFNSTRQGNDTTTYALSVDYALAPGLTPFAELVAFEMDPADSTTAKNKGTVLMLGTLLNF